MPRDGRFLLVEEKVRGELVLNQPAGHLEPHESLLDAARRETQEETGWSIAIEHLSGSTNGPAPKTNTFCASPSPRARWTTTRGSRSIPASSGRSGSIRDEIAAANARPRSPLVLRCIDDWLAGTRLPLSAVQALAPA